MKIDEFTDTYSDDLIYLHQGRAALLTHPLRGEYAVAKYLDGSFCRMLAVFVIGSIEGMLETWREHDPGEILEKYFENKASNGERVASLYDAFHRAGIRVDGQVFADYLAIKYLRNTIVHGRWKQHEKEWLDRCGFPTDTRELTKEHLDKIEHVNQSMMFYIFLATQSDPNSPKPEKLVKLGETVTRRTDETGILRLRDIDRIIWNNLERIDAYIYSHIERTVTTERYNWMQGRSRDDLEGLDQAELKRLFFLSARRAGEEDYHLLAQHRDLAKEALAFWREYCKRAVVARGLDDERIERALQLLTSPYFDPRIELWSNIAKVPERLASRLINDLLKGQAPFTPEQVVDALQAGNLAYELIPNITPVSLFALRLPIVDPANSSLYCAEAEHALRAFKLNCVWYSCVEYRRGFTEDDLHFYSRMCQEFAHGRE